MGSEIINKIKLDRVAALKARDEGTKSALSVLLGEFDRHVGSKDLTDELATTVITKLCKNLEESITMVEASGQDAASDKAKLAVISRYRPNVLDHAATAVLIEKVKSRMDEADRTNIGKVMAALKPYSSGIDMKLASSLVRGT